MRVCVNGEAKEFERDSLSLKRAFERSWGIKRGLQ